MPSSSPRRRLNRSLAIAGAALEWTVLVAQLILLVRSFEAAGLGALAGVVRYTGFFTIWGNLLAALVLTRSSSDPDRATGLTSPRVELAAAAAMVVIDAIYAVLLRQVYHPEGVARLVDVGLHDVAPVVFVLFWVTRPHRVLRLIDVAACLVAPGLYLVTALARGAIEGWYPYPFLDVTSLGMGRVALNSVAIAVLFLAVGVVLWVIDRGLGRWRRR